MEGLRWHDLPPLSPFTFGQYLAVGAIEEHHGSSCVIPPHGFILAETFEELRIPEDCLAEVIGKSTWARCGITLITTPLEPGWQGRVTLEIANLTPFPVEVFSWQGIGQVVFAPGHPCDVPYNKKPGASYQDQTGITAPRA